ncbi:MAG: hypothetical protein ABI852_08250 [Gemmatimonadaceae bacterium]
MQSPRVSLGLFLLIVWPFSDIVLNAQTHAAQTTHDGPVGKVERTVDKNIKPGDDFFAYANGAWL